MTLVGRAAEHHWTPAGASEAAAILNRTVDESGDIVFPHVEIKDIPGLQDSAEPGSIAHKKVGRRGEKGHPNYRSGKTYLYNGIIRATSMRELDEYRYELRAAFEDQSAVGRMDHIPRTESGHYTEADNRFYEGTPLGLEMPDLGSGGGGLWRASFSLGVRNHEGVYYEELEAGEALAAFKEYIIDLEPELYWALDADDGADDLSGNNRDGTGQGGITIGGAAGVTAIPDDSATDFDGTDDYIASSYNPFGTGSVRTFVCFTALPGSSSRTVFGGLGASAEPQLRLSSSGAILNTDNSEMALGALDTAFPADTVSVAAVIDDADPRRVALYANGEFVDDLSPVSGVYNTPGDLAVGAWDTPAAQFFDGPISHFMVFGELTDDEIAGIHERAFWTEAQWMEHLGKVYI